MTFFAIATQSRMPGGNLYEVGNGFKPFPTLASLPQRQG